MSDRINKIVNIILWVLLGISVVFGVFFYLGKVVPGTEGTNIQEPVVTNAMLTWAYVLFGITLVITLVFSIINVIANPANAKKGLISVLFIGVVFVAGYFLASDTPLNMPGYEGSGNIPSVIKWVGTGLNAAYILAVLAILAIFYVEIAKIFK
ncbi:MAG: hypothetical protein GXO83_11005 [Chlorobi bacterium]|nr:hypothetical protein [Chlorobiota bacterium]